MGLIETIRSWFEDSPQRPLPRPKKARHLPVLVVEQEFPYSCCASVLQATTHFLSGRLLSHQEAIHLTNCNPDGAQLEDIAMVLRKECRVRTKALRSRSAVRAALKAGNPVISCDNISYAEPHAVLLVDATQKGFYVADSIPQTIRWKSAEWIKRAADEFIVVYPRRKVLKPRSS